LSRDFEQSAIPPLLTLETSLDSPVGGDGKMLAEEKNKCG
jgi:hypothetical protein